jgi:hypothetical protein
VLCLVLTLAATAFAQFTRDNAANKKIDEAVNEHYLATDFDKAEGILTGTVAACGEKCSPQVIARAWMYVGIVRGSGRNDQAGAKEAFQKAIAADPQVKLDAALATPETQKTFESVGGAGAEAPPVTPPAPAPAAEPPAAGGAMRCTPSAIEVQTRRPIPIECITDEDAASAELRYRPFGGDWKTLKMTKKGDAFRAEIPCADTGVSGELSVYASAKDAAGEVIDNWANRGAPIVFTIAEGVTAPPPSYPGESAPARCADAAECPPDFPGCGQGSSGRGNVDWGGKCENSTQCKQGLLCEGGVCETAPSCEVDADCSTGRCVEGRCDIPAGEGAAAGPFKKNWLGLHFGADVAIVGGADVCAPGNGYVCYLEGSRDQPYVGPPYPGTGIKTGTALGTLRVMLSYERAFTPNIAAGVRAGYALLGGPPALNDGKEVPFLPVHAEARVSYWIGPGALGKKGLRPYVFVAGGLAQVDAKVKVTVYDCAGEADPTNCGLGNTGTPATQREVDAWKKLGQGFAGGGLGLVYAFQEQLGVQLNVAGMFMLPDSGAVIQPSLGVVYGL